MSKDYTDKPISSGVPHLRNYKLENLSDSKQELVESVKTELYSLRENFNEYAHHCEDSLIDILPFISYEGLRRLKADAKRIQDNI